MIIYRVIGQFLSSLFLQKSWTLLYWCTCVSISRHVDSWIQHGMASGGVSPRFLLCFFMPYWALLTGSTGQFFLDLSRAFGCVSHEPLVVKLEGYGFRGTGLKLLKFYISLSNRAGCGQRQFLTPAKCKSRSSSGLST